MSFRGDDQRRYGHVPPVQYPIGSRPPQEQHHHQQSQGSIGRRSSFDSGDDLAYYGITSDRSSTYGSTTGAGEEDLFLANQSGSHASIGRSAYGSTNSALSGYQHQYQDAAPPTPSHSSYNPQSFAQMPSFPRSQSTNTLPYRSQPPSRYASNASSYNASPPTTFTPQTYNPAAYAGATSPQRQSTYSSFNNYTQSYSATGAPQISPNLATASYTSAFPHSASSPALSPGYEEPLQSPLFGPPGSQNQTYDPAYNAQGQYGMHASNGGSPQPGSQAPYPVTTQMPVGPYYSANEHNTLYNRPSRSSSQVPAIASPPVPSQSASPRLQRHPANAPLPIRPVDMPEEPIWAVGNRLSEQFASERLTQESIMEDIEAELGNSGHEERQRPIPANGQISDDEINHLRRYDSGATTIAATASRTSSARRTNYSYEDDDDDPEGTAGVLAMQQAELDDRRFSGNTFHYSDVSVPVLSNPLPPPPEEQLNSSDSEFGGMVDLGMLSGGYAGTLTYGENVVSPPASSEGVRDGARPLPTPGYFNQGVYENHEAAPAFNNAEIDYGGTGGLQPVTGHRLSFDEGDERVSLHSRQSGTESPTKDDYQDLFYHPGLSSRPLPALPPAPGSDSSSMLSVQTGNRRPHSYSMSTDSRTLYNPDTPENYYASGSPYSQYPERSISLTGHSHTPVVQTPARSRTDAAEERKKLNRHQQLLTTQGPLSDYTTTNTSMVAFDGITLPSGRKKKFIPSKLNAADFRKCVEPWALSGIEAWVREMGEGEIDLRNKTIEEAVINLFIHKVPTMNVADAEALSNRVVSLMLEQGLLVPDEEWVKFGDGHIYGVLWQLTGLGCYAPKLHEGEDTNGRCYSYHCTRTLKKVDLDDLMPPDAKPPDDWHVFYGLKKEDWESKPKKEVDRQNILHEIVSGEENYIKQLDIFRKIYRDGLRASSTEIIHPDKRDKFLDAVFGKIDIVQEINKDHLLAQLKYRQQEQGPWITGFSDLFREWIRKAKSIYIEYASAYPRATYMIRREADRNYLFKKFLEDMQRHKNASKQDWTHYLITPLQRLQRYILLLESVDHKMIGDSEEKSNLAKAIAEIKTVTHECDAKVAEMNKRVEMMELNRMIVLRPGFGSVLNLDHLGRELIHQGDLQRMGSKGVRWVDTHALLFDHYFILAKTVASKDGKGDKKFDVSKEPIPMPLLFLESMNDEAIQKQKGITAPLARTTTASNSTTQLNKIPSNAGGRPGLEHAQTNSSLGSSHLTPGGSNDFEGKILYPFKVKHLGHEIYTLFASSARDRVDWCNKIIETKTRHAKALFSQNAEPFRLRVLADAAFHYDITSPYARSAGVPVKGTPLDRAIQELEKVLGPAQGVAPVCRAQVNCATGFTAFGKSIIAIGTDYGVFISDPSNPRGWSRSVQASKVTQIAVLEEFSVCLIITDRNLVSYPLDVIAPVSDFAPPVNDNPRRAPQRLAKDVTYFATGKMKERMLVIYKRKEGLHTTFKVLEPIIQKSAEKKRGLFGGRRVGGGSSTDTFRDFDEFFFPTECYSLNLFQTYIAVSTAKGVEMLTLDKKQPMSIPDLKAPAIANIASRIRDQRPLGMFKLNDNEFILTYEDCAVYVDKHGDVSRTLIMEYTGKQKKARGATMYGQYLLLFNEDYVEVRNAENGRLRQIIAGRDVRVLDYGVRGPTGGNALHSQNLGQINSTDNENSKGTVKLAMCHPELQGRQIVLEMLLNDGHTEK